MKPRGDRRRGVRDRLSARAAARAAGGREVAGDDRATRARVHAAARRLFVEKGFQRVTVREITDEARANIAAVSYHFRDKLGLYREVLQEAIDTAQEGFEAAKAPAGTPPEERLRHFLRASLHRLSAADEGKLLIQQLMRHEMLNPTPALPFIIERASLPRMRYLADIVADVLQLPPEDPVVGLHVASIHAQFLLHMKSALREQFFADWGLHLLSPERVADHIVEFTLGALGAAAGARVPRRRSGAGRAIPGGS